MCAAFNAYGTILKCSDSVTPPCLITRGLFDRIEWNFKVWSLEEGSLLTVTIYDIY